MADLKISQLTEDTTPVKTNVLAEVDSGGASKKVTIASLAKAINYWSTSESVADDGTIALPTITANYAARGFIIVSAAGVIEQSAEFEIDSTGTAQIIRGSALVTINADTDLYLCIGTAAAQNPMTVKNRLGGTKLVMINLWYA